MSTYRLRTPDTTIDLGEFDVAQDALHAAASRHPENRSSDATLEVLVGEDWHEVDVEGDMP